MEVSGGRLDDHRRSKRKYRARSAVLGTVELAPHSANAHDILDLSAGAICLVDRDPYAGALVISILDTDQGRAALETFVARQGAFEDGGEILVGLSVRKSLERE
jgi:hypothetical protein